MYWIPKVTPPWDSGMHWSDSILLLVSFGGHPRGGAVRCRRRRTAARGKKGDFGRLWAQCARNIGSHFCSRHAAVSA